MAKTLSDAQLRIVPANEASWSDVQMIFGERGDAHGCQCQWFKASARDYRELSWQELEQREREITNCGDPHATTTTGLVAFLDDDPAAWVAVEPRINYPRMQRQRIPWQGRDEDRDDPDVWAITCFVTRVGYRGRGLMSELTIAAADYAKSRGARAVEGYPLVAEAGEKLGWGELFVGARSSFEAAGFSEVSRPSARRAVMRLEFAE
ncbi:GNAT family N-acetyltransferase [Gryllotalpicola koreensis]|uniref:GNAT family N-acetyltransferase n=2 Tax=Gryllotalpicola koreensis TaxID=993086 RepID=A0ABP8ADK7_9MICO